MASSAAIAAARQVVQATGRGAGRAASAGFTGLVAYGGVNSAETLARGETPDAPRTVLELGNAAWAAGTVASYAARLAGAARVAAGVARVASPLGWLTLAGELAYFAYRNPEQVSAMGDAVVDFLSPDEGGKPSRGRNRPRRRAYLNDSAKVRAARAPGASRAAAGRKADRAGSPSKSASSVEGGLVTYTRADGSTGQYTQAQAASFRRRRRGGNRG